MVVWNIASGEQVSTLKGHTGPVNSVSWGQGDQFASASDVTWNSTSSQHVSTLQGHTNDVNSVVWSPNGSPLASASADQTGIVWDTTAGAKASALKGPAGEMAQDEKELQRVLGTEAKLEIDTLAQARLEASLPALVSDMLQSWCCVIS